MLWLAAGTAAGTTGTVVAAAATTAAGRLNGGVVDSPTEPDKGTCSWVMELEVELGPEPGTEADDELVDRAPVEARSPAEVAEDREDADVLWGEPWRLDDTAAAAGGLRFSGRGGCGGVAGMVTAV